MTVKEKKSITESFHTATATIDIGEYETNTRIALHLENLYEKLSEDTNFSPHICRDIDSKKLQN